MANDTEMDLQYIISADSSKLTAGMAAAQKTAEAGAAGISDSAKKMAEQTATATSGISGMFARMATSIVGANAEIAASSTAAASTMAGGFRNAATGVQGAFGGISGAFNLVKNNLGLLAGVLAGGAAFKEAIDSTNKWNGEAMKLSKQLGISTQDASVYMVAMHKLGIESDTLASAANKVSMQILKGGKGFEVLGVAVKDATGHFRPAMEIIGDTNEKLKAIQNPILQNQAGISAYGKAWQDMRPMLKLTGDELDKAREKAKALNLEVSPEQAAASKKYKENMNEFSLALKALSINIGQAVMPVFAKLTGALAETAGAIITIMMPAFDLLASAFDIIVPIFKGFMDVMREVGKALVEGLGATFHAVFGESIPGDIDYVAGVVNAFKTFFIGFKIGILEAFEAIKLGVNLMKNAFITWVEVAKAALSLDWAGAKAAIATGAKNAEAELSSSMNRMAKIAEDGAKQIADTWSGVAKPKAAPKAETKDAGPDLDFTKQKKENIIKGFESELALKKANFETTNALEGHYIEFTKLQEQEFWTAKLKLVAKGSEDYKAIQMKIAQDRIEIAKAGFAVELAGIKAQEADYKNNTDKKLEFANEYLSKVITAYGKESTQAIEAQRHIVEIKRQSVEQQKAIDEIRVKTAQDHNLSIIDAEESLSKMRSDLMMQSNLTTLAQEVGFEDRRYEIKRKGAEDALALALLDPDRNPVAVAKLNAELEGLEMAHQSKIKSIKQASVLEQNKGMLSVVSALQGGMTQMIKSVATGTMSIGGAMKSFMLSMADAVVGILAKMAAEWATIKIAEMIWGKTAAISGVASNAAIAGAAATASAAAIPVVGWAMAPAAGAAAFTAAMAFGASIPAAAKGFDIPAGVNPITQLHEKEMVLPAKQADVIRNMADSGDTGGGVNITIHAVDAHSVRRLFENNGAALADVIRKQKRNFAL